MNSRRSASRAAALKVLMSAVVAGCAVDGASPGPSAQAGAAARAVSVPAAVVVAERPTLSEILDIILRERPTAEELTGSRRTGGFPQASDEAHVSRILRGYTSDAVRADRIAVALVREGRRRNVGSSLLVGVLLTENPWLDPRAKSFVGATGLMQVMPFHAGKWGCDSPDLFDIESNICHGVAVLADNLSRSKTLPKALLGYNGCVRGTNTPDCHRYPSKVYRYARKTTEQAAESGDAAAAIRPFTR